MYKIFKFFHFIGLTLFLGSIWVYIAQGTPMGSAIVTTYARANVASLIQHVTLPGLMMMILTGFCMMLIRRSLLKSVFFKIKLSFAILAFIDANYILSIAKQSAIYARNLPSHLLQFNMLITQESILGAINVAIILFLIGYSMNAKKFSST